MSIIWLHSANRRGHKNITWWYAEHSDVANVTSADYNGVCDSLTSSQCTHHLIKCTSYYAEPTYPIHMFS